MVDVRKLDRREFARLVGVTTGSFMVLGLDPVRAEVKDKFGRKKTVTLNPNLFIAIGTDDSIRLVCHRTEMGQGIRTAIPMLLAEELNVSMDSVQVVQAKGDEKYGDQNTDGSRSIRQNWTRLRRMGAATREMLVQAAAKTWSVKAASCRAEDGRVHHDASGRSLSYGELVETARELDVPEEPKLKDRKDFRLLGKAQPLYDRSKLVTGEPVFGMDVTVPNMKYAALKRCPTVGGTLKAHDDKKALEVFGVEQVVPVEGQPQDVNTNDAVAVIASNTWSAFKGRDAVAAEWDLGENASAKSEDYRKALSSALKKADKVALEEGKAPQEKAEQALSRTYYTPFLVHAPMEPPVCTAWVKDDGSCEVWAPTQDPQRARKAIANYLGVEKDKVTVNVTFLGGAFGRKSQPDFVLESVIVSKKIGAPVKVVWSREDEVRHGLYHAAAMQNLEARTDGKGGLHEWTHKTVFPTVMTVFKEGADTPQEFELGMGATNMPYRAAHKKVVTGNVGSPIRVAWFRAVCNNFHSHAINCFVDELAEKAGQDPVDYRLALLGEPRKLGDQDTGRLGHVIQTCRSFADWDKRRKAGRALGFASHYSFESYVAVALEAEIRNGSVHVPRADIVIDCGQYVNPDTVRAQMEGSVAFGLSAALMGEITFKDGQVVQSNYDTYPVLRMDSMPEVRVKLVESDDPPEGVGEPGVPPVLPALVNAVYAASGQRAYELPLSQYDFS